MGDPLILDLGVVEDSTDQAQDFSQLGLKITSDLQFNRQQTISAILLKSIISAPTTSQLHRGNGKLNKFSSSCESIQSFYYNFNL